MSILCISHNIFLTKEQRYDLYKGNIIEVVGVSVPVWFHNRKETNEPAVEIFCKYILKCENKHFHKNIEITNEGYEITLLRENFTTNIQNKIKKYFKLKQNNYTPSAKSLLDIKDGGSEWLNFQIYETTDLINILHSIEIQKIENLLNSLVC